ncbi:MAG: hypothetical protein R3D98_15955 [Candidatus Krumholzibacteriia bacterium]
MNRSRILIGVLVMFIVAADLTARGDAIQTAIDSSLPDMRSTVTFIDPAGAYVRLSIPPFLVNDQCQRRLIGNSPDVLGLFGTLYSGERRREAYERAIRELCLQPELGPPSLGDLEELLASTGLAAGDIREVVGLLDAASQAYKKNYVSGATLGGRLRNTLAHAGRELNRQHKLGTFAAAGLALEDVQATAELTEIVAGAFLLNALATDVAAARLDRIRDELTAIEGQLDPEIIAALIEADINLRAAQAEIGALAVSINDNLDEIGRSILSLGACLADITLKLSPAVAMWIGAPLMTLQTLQAISDQWELAQDAVAAGTIAMLLLDRGDLQGGPAVRLAAYGLACDYLLLREAFSTNGARWRDFLRPGRTNGDLADHCQKTADQILASLLQTDAVVGPAVREPFGGLSAGGTEPFWTLVLGADGSARFSPSHDGSIIRATCIPSPTRDGHRRFSLAHQTRNARQLDIEWFDQTCGDGMSDRRYPATVLVTWNGAEYEGCARELAPDADVPALRNLVYPLPSLPSRNKQAQFRDGEFCFDPVSRGKVSGLTCPDCGILYQITTIRATALTGRGGEYTVEIEGCSGNSSWTDVALVLTDGGRPRVLDVVTISDPRVSGDVITGQDTSGRYVELGFGNGRFIRR